MDGLAKTAIMVEKLEGKLWVEKLPGRGNTWWFTFNVEPSHSRNYPFKELSDSGSLPDWSDKTILVVEDVSNNYLLPEPSQTHSGNTYQYGKLYQSRLRPLPQQTPQYLRTHQNHI